MDLNEQSDKKISTNSQQQQQQQQQQQTNNSPTLTVDQLDIEILPTIYEIIRCIEKTYTDNAVKQRESLDCSHRVLELQKRFESARNQIRQLPGIDYNKEEQLQRAEVLRKQLILKQQLIKKYKNNHFL